MRFTYLNREYSIRFQYAVIARQRGMYCYIEFWDEHGSPAEASIGWSKCMEPEDRFVKEKGRKIALKRAVTNPYIKIMSSDPDEKGVYHWESYAPEGFDPKAFRTAAWKAYLGRSRDPGRKPIVLTYDGKEKKVE